MISPLSSLPSPTVAPPTITPVTQKMSTALFVPYWSLTNAKIQKGDFDTLIYFGISANSSGIDTDDLGYKKLSEFTRLLPANTPTVLTVRMIDSAVNSKVLEDTKVQEKIIHESIALAKKYNFSGILFDFEINALAFPSVVTNITNFYKAFYTQTKKDTLSFDITLYGDTFYRARPYDVKTIAAYTDQILIMSYDFHKARGNPGPNFPLSGKEVYGYDLGSMLEDFGKNTSLQKVTIVFGLFGYDWMVDNKKQSVSLGEPLSYLAIHQKYITKCLEKECMVKQDKKSAETEVSYTDNEGKRHTIWFEDPESIERKKLFLSEKGLRSTAIWAYSYY